jgi:DNA-binding transcriptional ArsR family regulator
MIPEIHTPGDMAQKLGISEAKIQETLGVLKEMGLVSEKDGLLEPCQVRMHLEKNSPTFKRYHSAWRQKIAHDVTSQLEPSGVHYTAALTISRANVAHLRKLLLEHIDATREIAVTSDPEEIYLCSLDFYSLT